MRVWREGDRIRQEDGRGYGDMVPDERIEDRCAAATAAIVRAADVLDFGLAVLSLRKRERMAAPEAPGGGT